MARRCIVGLLCSLAVSTAWSGNTRREQLAIRILDYAPVPPDTLEQAISLSQGIFRKAGIDTTWLACRPFVDEQEQCNPPIQPTEVLLRILVKSAEKQTAASGALGCVLRDKKSAFALYVFYGRVEQVAHFAPFDPSVLLGMVITHELGHFFGLGDGLGGIMLSSFHLAEMMQAASGTLTFDRHQAECLRTRVATRDYRLQR